MMPGILHSAREQAKQPESVIPIWWVFTEGLATSDRYQREIRHWFRGMESYVLLWSDPALVRNVTDHFDQHIRPRLT